MTQQVTFYYLSKFFNTKDSKGRIFLVEGQEGCIFLKDNYSVTWYLNVVI